MSERAQVNDVEALDRFRSRLVVYLERAGQILDEVGEEVKRTRVWLQSERRIELGRILKRAHRQLEALEQEMFSARLSGIKSAKTGQQMKINRMRRTIREIEEKQQSLRRWTRNFDASIGVELAKVEKLRHVLDTDVANGVRGLAESLRSLDEYISGAPTRREPKPGKEEE